MTIDEAIEREKLRARVDRIKANKKIFHNNDEDEISALNRSAEEHEQLADWLEKLQYIENIILKWNADWYNDEDTGIPDNEILEAIFNACTDNGFDIQIDEDYIKGKKDGYNKAIDDFVDKAIKVVYEANNRDRNPKPRDMVADINYKLLEIAEQLKEGGVDAGSI